MVDRERVREYAKGSLWVLPGISALIALAVGFVMSQIYLPADSPLGPLAFQGTADDARAMLANVTATVVTVIALVMGLTVVALQLSSTQFSPRLLRNFLRDRPNQVVLSIFVATFAYSAAGLYTVGVKSGTRVEEYPRLAVSGSILLLFASLAAVVYFADHIAHSIQIDAIGGSVEMATLAIIRTTPDGVESDSPTPPDTAVPLRASRSGYLQTVRPAELLQVASRQGVVVRLRTRVGEHVVAGTILGWMWTLDSEAAMPDPAEVAAALDRAARVGFERTLEQDAGFGIRQLCDMACKALSPAVNDPYTGVQAVDHLSVVFCALAQRPLGDLVLQDPHGRGVLVVPGRRFGEYVSSTTGQVRRYGASEPIVAHALLRLLGNCADVLPDGSPRWADLAREASLVAEDATRTTAQPADLIGVQRSAEAFAERARPHLSQDEQMPATSV